MRKETDLHQVKATARALLMLDLGETDFSPVIVKHPFTDSGITAIPKPDGSIQMLNLMDDPTDLKRWRDFVSQTIKKAGSAYEVYMMITKPYGLTFLKFVYRAPTSGNTPLHTDFSFTDSKECECLRSLSDADLEKISTFLGWIVQQKDND